MAELDTLREAGFTEGEIQTHFQPKVKALNDAGFSQEEIDKHIGIKPVDVAQAANSISKRMLSEVEKIPVEPGANTSPTKVIEPTAFEKVNAAVEAIANTAVGLVSMIPSSIAAITNVVNTAAREKRLLTPDELGRVFVEAGAVMNDPMFNESSELGKEYTEAIGKVISDIGIPIAGVVHTVPSYRVPIGPSIKRMLSSKRVTESEIYTHAKEIAPDSPHAVVKEVSEKLQKAYEKSGIDPETIKNEAIQNPTVLQDIISDNIDAPKAMGAASEKVQGQKTASTDVLWTAKDKNRLAEPSSTDLTELKADIAKNGIKKPVTITVSTADGMGYVTDGNNRLAAAKELGIKDIPYKVETTDVPFTPEQLAKAKTIGELGIKPGELAPKVKSKEALDAEAWLKDQTKELTPEVAEEVVLSRISVGEKHARVLPTIDEIYTAIKDELHPIGMLEKKLSPDGKLLPASESPTKLAVLTRGSAGKARQFIENGTFKFDTYETSGPSLMEILKPFNGKKDANGLRAFMLSRHIPEAEAAGKATGVPIAAANVVAKSGVAKYESGANKLAAYRDSTLQYLVDSGVVSKDSAAQMRAAFENYVPIHRLFDEVKPSGAGAGLKIRNPIKGRTGSERIILDPIETLIKDTYLFTALAERNAVGKAIGNLVFDVTGKVTPEAEAMGISRVKPSIRPTEVSAKEVQKFMDEYGISGDPEAFTVFRADAMRPGPNQIRYFEDGKPVILEVPKDLADAFNATNQYTAGMLVNMLSIPAKTLRAGTVLSPGFILPNIVVDQITATMFSKNGYRLGYDFVRGAMETVKEGEAFQNFLKGGGSNSAMISMDRQYLQQHLLKLDADTGLMSRSFNVLTHPLEPLRLVSELTDQASRVGDMRRGQIKMRGTEDRPMTKAEIQELSFNAREVTLDFQRIGAQTHGINMIAAFFNVGLEGTDRMVRALKDDPKSVSAKIAAGITIPSILLWYANNNTPERKKIYQEIPEYQRDLFWIIIADEDHVFRIKKPYEMGVLFGSFPERLLDKFAAEKPEAMKGFMKSIGSAFMPNVLPTASQPILEQMTGYSFFTGNPLIPRRLEELLPEYQYNDYSTELSKALGRVIGAFPGMKQSSTASPLVVDNYVRGWTGSLGVYIEQALDLSLRKAGVLPDPVMPISTLADLPVIKAFVVRYPSASAQSIQDFYEKSAERKKVYDTFKYLVDTGDVDAAIKEAKLAPSAFARVDGFRESIGILNKNIRLITKNPSFSPSDKRQLIDAMYGQMAEIARTGNEAMREIDKVLEK